MEGDVSIEANWDIQTFSVLWAKVVFLTTNQSLAVMLPKWKNFSSTFPKCLFSTPSHGFPVQLRRRRMEQGKRKEDRELEWDGHSVQETNLHSKKKMTITYSKVYRQERGIHYLDCLRGKTQRWDGAYKTNGDKWRQIQGGRQRRKKVTPKVKMNKSFCLVFFFRKEGP